MASRLPNAGNRAVVKQGKRKTSRESRLLGFADILP
jgi:hypothetical protein